LTVAPLAGAKRFFLSSAVLCIPALVAGRLEEWIQREHRNDY